MNDIGIITLVAVLALFVAAKCNIAGKDRN